MSKVKLQRAQELTRTQREDGKQDAWNGHAQVASQAKAVPEEYEPDAARQEVRRDEQEFRTAQQQVKKMTQARARSESGNIWRRCPAMPGSAGSASLVTSVASNTIPRVL